MKVIMKSMPLLSLLACASLYTCPASAGTVMRSVTVAPDGDVVHSRTVTTNRAYVAPAYRTTTTRTVRTNDMPAPVASSSTTTTTTTTSTPVVTTYDTYVYNNDDSYVLRQDRRVGQTYAEGTDYQGNNALRYENRTHDGYNN